YLRVARASSSASATFSSPAPILLHCPFALAPPTSPSLLSFFFYRSVAPRDLHSFPTRRSSDLCAGRPFRRDSGGRCRRRSTESRSEEHTSELQSRFDLVCRLLLEKKKEQKKNRDACNSEAA